MRHLSERTALNSTSLGTEESASVSSRVEQTAESAVSRAASLPGLLESLLLLQLSQVFGFVIWSFLGFEVGDLKLVIFTYAPAWAALRRLITVRRSWVLNAICTRRKMASQSGTTRKPE